MYASGKVIFRYCHRHAPSMMRSSVTNPHRSAGLAGKSMSPNPQMSTTLAKRTAGNRVTSGQCVANQIDVWFQNHFAE